MLKSRSWNDTRGGCATTNGETAKSEDEAQATRGGPRCQQHFRHPMGFPHIIPSPFSQDSHLDPRSFNGHSLQLVQGAERWTVPSDSAPSGRAVSQLREHPGGCTSQLRKLKSGLFPNKRCPGWTVEDVRRPSLAEATTLVAQVDYCEAGLGRTVMGADHTKEATRCPAASRAGTLGTPRLQSWRRR